MSQKPEEDPPRLQGQTGNLAGNMKLLIPMVDVESNQIQIQVGAGTRKVEKQRGEWSSAGRRKREP